MSGNTQFSKFILISVFIFLFYLLFRIKNRTINTLHAEYIETYQQCSQNPILINVGLPRSGTQSFDDFLTRAGYKTAHVGYGELDKEAIAQFKNSGTGKIYDYMVRFKILSDSPYYGLIDSLKKHYPNIKLVATSRSKSSWLKSMKGHINAGGSYLRNIYSTKELSKIYDMHQSVLKKWNITKIDLELEDNKKADLLADVLNDPNLKSINYGKVDNYGKWDIFKNNMKI